MGTNEQRKREIRGASEQKKREIRGASEQKKRESNEQVREKIVEEGHTGAHTNENVRGRGSKRAGSRRESEQESR